MIKLAQLSRQYCRPRSALLPLVALLAAAGSGSAQVTSPLLGNPIGRISLCNPEQLAAAGQLTLQQRACWYGTQLASPWRTLQAGLISGIGQWQNDPFMKGRDVDDYAHRFAVYYAKRSARATGELIAGYLNHEDPRRHPSGQTNIKSRVRSALLSVLIVRGEDGSRVAFAPIAGSLGSAFAGAACYWDHTGAGYAFRAAGLSYGSYFGNALYQEFRPDISLFVARMRHKKKQD